MKAVPAVILLGEIALSLSAVGAFLRVVVVSPLRRWFRKHIQGPLDTLTDDTALMRQELREHIDDHDHLT